MTPEDFFYAYRDAFVKIMSKNIVEGHKKKRELGPGDITMCFNFAIYEMRKQNWSLKFEGKVGRGGYSDVEIKINGKKFCTIEHENSSASKQMKKNLNKLNQKGHNFLIMYYDTDNQFKRFLEEFMQRDEKNLFLILGKGDANKKNLFKIYTPQTAKEKLNKI